MEPRAATQERLCTLERMVGEPRPCPAEACAFWEAGGAVLAGGCAFERLDPAIGPDAAMLLLEIRAALDEADAHAERTKLRRALYRLLNAERDTD